ncbi:small peptidoglycan-associated lipoprotein [Neobacillus notoginsengisoli]|uniref:Small peptidoglycan-associated lipoprotein n=1 Tax=Neobacillus notoginsengisoli TaxID=1578198 RepID=A0A417YEM6_9BACI|nr:small peptidoglycan-associated lipoprotein [Neobacillus notoginsengisoli]RHW31127.1 small peptidoglycan-associated lipoprotein [Neobacillus notoginsengisoli]
MKGFPLSILVVAFVLTASCSKQEVKLALDKNAKQVIFFSEEKEFNVESTYYDALIELKNDFPDEMENLMVLSSPDEKKYYDEFDIESGPALIVIYNDKVMVRINGSATKEQIIKPVSNALANRSKKAK